MKRVARPGIVGRAAWGAKNFFATTFGSGAALPPWDDYWYQPYSVDSAAGMAVTPESAMRLAAVFSCIRVRSETTASLPLIIYRRMPGGGKERAPEHPLYRLLHDQPNQWQTALEFVEMMQGHLDLRGNAFARIVPGPSGPVDQLVPLHPDLVQVYRLPSGKLKYQVRSRFTAEVDWYLQEEILHLRGISADGLVGLSPIALQRETVGSGLGMQDHAGRFFANDSTPSGVIKHPGHFKDDAAFQRFKKTWQDSQTKSGKHTVAILEDGLDYHSIGVTNKDSQFIESQQLTAAQICGIYRVPPHKIAMLDRSTNNNIEHQGIEFVTDCIRPAVVRWQHRVNLDLIDPVSVGLGAEPGEYFAEFLVDGLLRGDMKSRYDAYAVGRNWGWLCPNDVCDFEGLNPIPDEKGGNEYLRPVNMAVAGQAAPVPLMPGQPASDPENAQPSSPSPNENRDKTPPPDEPEDEGEEAPAKKASAKLLQLFASEAAGRVVRREAAALRRLLLKSEGAFEEQAEKFYREHAGVVAQTMCISKGAAMKYARQNMRLLASIPGEERPSALDWIEDTSAQALADLALGARHNGAGKSNERCVQ